MELSVLIITNGQKNQWAPGDDFLAYLDRPLIGEIRLSDS